MKKKFLFLILSIIISINSTVYGYNVPEKIRVGLYYDSTSLNSFVLSSKNNINISINVDNKKVEINNYIGKSCTVTKDINKYKFYIKCGEDFNNFSGAYNYSSSLNNSGINAYILFDGKWHVCVGYYFTSEDEGWIYIADNIIPKAGEGMYNVISKSTSKKTIINENDKVRIIVEYDTPILFTTVDNTINCNGKNYRGAIESRRIENSDMAIVNELAMDEYLYGVVPSEIQASSNVEALKTQAVAARTYAISQLGKHKKFNFDVCSTTDCQVYKGFDYEYESTNKAVDDTSGELVLYNNEPASVFYFSSSGGKTEDVENVWTSVIPYLRSVEDKYESGKSTNYNWSLSFTSDEIRNKLKKYSIDIGNILNLNIAERTNAGRVLKLNFIGENGEKTIEKSKCRTYLGLNSQLYDIKTDADINYLNKNLKGFLKNKKVITSSGEKYLDLENINIISSSDKKIVKSEAKTYEFLGKGWGHAVGLSQEGARGMAENGFTYIEILKHYFTGVEVK